MEDFVFVKVEFEDLKELENLAAETGFDLGLKNRQICYSLSPDKCYFVKTKATREFIGFICSHVLSPNLYLRYQVYIRPKFRTGGSLLQMAPRFEDITFPNYQGNFFYNCNNTSLRASISHQPGEIIGPKWLVYEGMLDRKRLGHIPHSSLDEKVSLSRLRSREDLELIKNYDRSLNVFPRDKFLNEWLLDPKEAITVFAADSDNGNQVVGYANARKHVGSDYWVNMGYAENENVMVSILKRLFTLIPEGTTVWMATPSGQRAMIQLFKSFMDFKWVYADHRVYGREVVPVPWEKVFIAHEYFLF